MYKEVFGRPWKLGLELIKPCCVRGRFSTFTSALSPIDSPAKSSPHGTQQKETHNWKCSKSQRSKVPRCIVNYFRPVPARPVAPLLVN